MYLEISYIQVNNTNIAPILLKEDPEDSYHKRQKQERRDRQNYYSQINPPGTISPDTAERIRRQNEEIARRPVVPDTRNGGRDRN